MQRQRPECGGNFCRDMKYVFGGWPAVRMVSYKETTLRRQRMPAVVQRHNDLVREGVSETASERRMMRADAAVCSRCHAAASLLDPVSERTQFDAIISRLRSREWHGCEDPVVVFLCRSHIVSRSGCRAIITYYKLLSGALRFSAFFLFSFFFSRLIKVSLQDN
jgi:hypothetical protein